MFKKNKKKNNKPKKNPGAVQTKRRERTDPAGRCILTCSVLQDAFLVVVAILFFVLCIYAFFYLNLSTELNLDVDAD